MYRSFSLRRMFATYARALALVIVCALVSQAQSSSSRSGALSAEQKTARVFESIRKSPPQQLAFLLKMPKGGDLHNHLSGSVYAERYIDWAAAKGLCVNQATMVLSESPCNVTSGQVAASEALTNPILYRQMVDAWSMRFWELSGQNGHDHFFDSFVKFGAATWGQNGPMLADAVSRAARGNVLYLELMLTPDGGVASQIGGKIPWDGNFASMLDKLKSASISKAVEAGITNLQTAEAEKDKILKCGTAQADPGCNVNIRYIAQVSRGSSLGVVYAQMVTGFELANNLASKVVALNLVQAEDGLTSMQNFSLHMQMLNYLKPLYPKAHITLHAGELAPGGVPPDGMTFHIRESVMIAQAERIGHGVDIMHEDDPYGLMKEMARRNVMVEICLTSNDVILGVRKEHHPLATYMQHGVPVALATDDEGVSRSEISREFLKAADEQGLGYVQLKTMVRNSLQYSFLPGLSLWGDARNFVVAPQCRNDLQRMTVITDGCRQFLAGNEKAKLQWKLEEDLRAFEKSY